MTTPLSGTLFLCATPIGNLGDITLRVLETLKNVDLIACEDTRKTLQLLNHFDIKKPLTSYYEHNKNEKGPYLIERLKNGENIALVSDAGMPGISDPGHELVLLCQRENIPYTVLPGASAAATALVLSGLDNTSYSFYGFLSRNKKERAAQLTTASQEKRTFILYEAPHHLKETLKDLAKALGENREIALCRELTKKFEEVKRGTIGEMLDFYASNDPRGEYVLVLAGCILDSAGESKDLAWALARTAELLSEMREKDAIKQASLEANLPKREVYNAFIKAKSPK